jgi:hypothetical protein
MRLRGLISGFKNNKKITNSTFFTLLFINSVYGWSVSGGLYLHKKCIFLRKMTKGMIILSIFAVITDLERVGK